MPTSYWTALLIGLAAGSAITAASMLLLGFRRVHHGDRTALVPEIDRTPLRHRLAGLRERLAHVDRGAVTVVALIAVMAAAVIYGQVRTALFTAHQRDCNDEFRSTSLKLRRIATEDRELEAADDALRNRRDDVLADLVEALATAAPGTDARALLHDYQTTTAALDVQRDRLIADRAALEDRRRAQPTVPERC